MEVNEKNRKATATAVVMALSIPPTHSFEVEHPFVFIIDSRADDSFSGHVLSLFVHFISHNSVRNVRSRE